jgi:hypothetical protein
LYTGTTTETPGALGTLFGSDAVSAAVLIGRF